MLHALAHANPKRTASCPADYPITTAQPPSHPCLPPSQQGLLNVRAIGG